jgi:hypothetical protein
MTAKQAEMLLGYARDVVAAYERVTTTNDWVTLSSPIVALRAVIWRVDDVITDEQDRMDAGWVGTCHPLAGVEAESLEERLSKGWVDVTEGWDE